MMRQVLVVAATVALLAPLPMGAAASCDGLYVIRNATSLTTSQKSSLVKGMYRMKAMTSAFNSSSNAWDYFVSTHKRANEPGYVIHAGHNFFPWHRELMYRFRTELARAMEVPVNETGWVYWDWASPASTAAMFAMDFVGGVGDPANQYVLKDGLFTPENWHIAPALAALPGEKSSGGVVRAAGNGMQMCLDAANNYYLLDTIYNPPTVDSQATVGPFRLIVEDAPPTDTVIFLTPAETNRDCAWNNHTCTRRYTNSTGELQCRHYAPELPTNADYAPCIATLHPYDNDHPAPVNLGDIWGETSDFFTNQSYWRACMEGLDSSDKFTVGIERLGVSTHPPHGAAHTASGGTLATPSSPNDPAFFGLHHNVDRYFAEYSALSQNHWWLHGPGAKLVDTDLPLFPGVKIRDAITTAHYGYTYDTLC